MTESAAGYEYLVTYKLSTVIYDGTVEFVKTYLNQYSRTCDQMVQAGRSGRQNIAEGYMQLSLANYIKLCGVALGSQEELLKDYEDYARQNGVRVYSISEARNLREVKEVWDLIKVANTPYRPNHPYMLPKNKELAVNLMLTLLNQSTYLLKKHITSLEKKFLEEGGYNENLYKKRVAYRQKPR